MALGVAGERERVTEVLESELEALPPGPARARPWLLLPAAVDNNDEILEYFERALVESESDPRLHAAVLGNLSMNETAIRVERVARQRNGRRRRSSRPEPSRKSSARPSTRWPRPEASGDGRSGISASASSPFRGAPYILGWPERVALVAMSGEASSAPRTTSSPGCSCSPTNGRHPGLRARARSHLRARASRR